MAKKPNNNTLKSAKSINLSKNPQSESAVSPWMDDYLDCFTFQVKPITEAFILRLAKDLLDWAQKEDSLVFRDFVDCKRIPERTYYKWVEMVPALKEAHIMAKGIIGSRREKGAITRRLDSNFVASSMPMYDQGWKDLLSWKAGLKDDQVKSGPVTININDLAKKVSPALQSE